MKEKLLKNRILFLKAVVIGLLPLLCCVVSCAMDGKSIADIYLPSSEWNDELFYFKQVEAILSHGYPQGYFGFNESHALKLSFAAWSPVLVLPWLIWGFLFGWNLMSPIICNIVLLTVAVVLFVLLTKPTWKQTGLLGILFCLFTPFPNYMLRGMPEIICFSMLIVYYGLLLAYQEKEKKWQLTLLFVFAAVMTLMRPYLVLFYLYPAYQLIRRNKWLGLSVSGVLLVAVLGCYAAINYYLGAEYFTPLFQTEWLTPFWEGHFWTGIKGIFAKLYSQGKNFMALTIEGFRSGIAEGAYFAGYLALMALFAWQFVVEFVKKNKKKALEYFYLAFCFFGMLVALLLMYKMKEGSKHLITFMAMGVFALAMMETKFFKKAMFFGALSVFLYSVKATSPMDYANVYATAERVAQVEYWTKVFDEKLTLETENVPSYDNTVIWVFSDEVDGESVITDWQILYGLPEGFGVSCCYADYVIENFDVLQSKYITIPVGGTLQEWCEDAGYTLIGADEKVCVYEINKSFEQLLGEMHMEIEGRGANALFLSSIPLSYDMEEDLWAYCLQNGVQGDFSMASHEELFQAVEELLSGHSIDTMYLYLDAEVFSPENSMSELFFELFENVPHVNKKILLYTPPLDVLANTEEEAREWYYSLVQNATERLSAENTKVYFLGDQEWFVGNRHNYRGNGVIEREFFNRVFFDMFYNDKYQLTAEDVTVQLEELEQLVVNRLQEMNYFEVQDSVYVFIGDSIFGNTTDSTSIPEVVASYSGATVFNIASGGLRASYRDEETLNGMLLTENFVNQTDILLDRESHVYDEISKWHAEKALYENAENLVFFINYGLNDYMGGSVLYGNEALSYEGAMQQIINTIKNSFPTAQIVLLTPSYISYYENGTAVVNNEGSVLEDYVQVVRDLAEKEDTYLLDIYEQLGITKENADKYLSDKVHHNEQGRLMYGKLICGYMKEWMDEDK